MRDMTWVTFAETVDIQRILDNIDWKLRPENVFVEHLFLRMDMGNLRSILYATYRRIFFHPQGEALRVLRKGTHPY